MSVSTRPRSTRLFHRCRATGCMEMVSHKMLMCAAHWRMVPKPLQAEVHSTYRTVTRKEASFQNIKAYTSAVQKAVEHVAALEFSRITATAASLIREVA